MDNIETLLKEKGLTKTALSELLGVKKQNLNGLMKNPTLETIKRFASVLDVPITALFAQNQDFIAFVYKDNKTFTFKSVRELKDYVAALPQD